MKMKWVKISSAIMMMMDITMGLSHKLSDGEEE